MVQQLHAIVTNVRTAAENSTRYAQDVGEALTELSAAIQQIGQHVANIEHIAMQTRMLSLNATIQAAKAQEHGAAFAVVATEVRQLADVTKKAAGEIHQLAESSLEMAGRVGNLFTQLVTSVHETVSLAQQINVDENLPKSV